MDTKIPTLLRVTAPHFVAGAVWEQVEGKWRCSPHVAPIIAWMRGKTPEQVKAYLQKKGWKYEWL